MPGFAASPVLDRFLSKVDQNGPIPAHRPDLGPCWLWTGHRDSAGYGRFDLNQRSLRAARFGYELLTAEEIPADMQPDHLCRNPPCVNPEHLEIVTSRENTMRGDSPAARHATKTHCDNGHEYTPENTRITPSGSRDCRQCGRERQKRTRDRRAASSTR